MEPESAKRKNQFADFHTENGLVLTPEEAHGIKSGMTTAMDGLTSTVCATLSTIASVNEDSALRAMMVHIDTINHVFPDFMSFYLKHKIQANVTQRSTSILDQQDESILFSNEASPLGSSNSSGLSEKRFPTDRKDEIGHGMIRNRHRTHDQSDHGEFLQQETKYCRNIHLRF